MNEPHDVHDVSPDEVRLAVARFVDGELAADEAAAFERRLLAEPELRAAVDELRGLRSMFAAGKSEPALRPSAGFSARVLREVRRLPTAAELRAVERAAHAGAESSGFALGAGFDQRCRRLLVAAALLIGVGVLALAGLIRSADPAQLHASEAELRQEMERLDAIVIAEEIASRGRAPR